MRALHRRLDRLARSRLAMLGLGFALVLMLAANILAATALGGLRLDLTEERLFTLSEATRRVLDDVDEPIHLRLVFSRALGEARPALLTYHARIRELLETYRDLSGGRVVVERIDPPPFSAAEDRVLAAGLRGIPVNEAGDVGYFGLIGTNAVDGLEVIPVFAPNRESFLEYDLTRRIHRLATARVPTVGVISTLPLAGGGRRWPSLDILAESLTLRPLGATVDAVPPDVDLLMLVNPVGLSPATLYAIDQFVLGGGRALVLLDPLVETVPGAPAATDEGFDRLLRAWGLAFDHDRVAGDLDSARRVTLSVDGRPTRTDNVVWLGLGPANLNPDDAVTGGLGLVNLASAGVLEPLDGATTRIVPLLRTGPRGAPLDASRLRDGADPVALFRDFVPGERALILAARVTGETATAFSSGPPPGVDPSAATNHLDRSAAPLDLIVVADCDLLHESLWLAPRRMLDQAPPAAFASNADFAANALENLAGGAALTGLRARGRMARPLHGIEAMRRDAERLYRTQERFLQDRLDALRVRLNGLAASRRPAGDLTLSAAERAELDAARSEAARLRRDLRQVRGALRERIDRLEAGIRFANIAAVPLLLGAAMTVVVLARRRHRVGNRP